MPELLNQLAEQPMIDEAAVAADIKRIREAAAWGNGLGYADRQQIDAFTANHAAYLDGVVGGVETNAGQKLEEQVVPMGGSVRFAAKSVRSNNGGRKQTVLESPPLNLEALGLPRLSKDVEGSVIGLAVRRDARGRSSGVAAVTRSAGGGTALYYLENLSAAADPSTNVQPRWKFPGSEDRAQLADGFVVNSEEHMNKTTDKGTVELTFEDPYDRSNTDSLTFIRPATKKVERQVTAQKPNAEGVRFGKTRAVGAVLGSMAALGAFVHFQTQHETPIRSASAMVANTPEINGIPQATANFPTDVRQRTYDAFNAYFKGDTTALDRQAESYHSEWISPSGIEAVKNATTMRELERAFDVAVGGTHITLHVGDTQAHLNRLQQFTDYTEAPATDVAAAQRTAVDVLQVLNTFDPASLNHQIGNLDFVLVSNLHGQNNETIGNDSADGFCAAGGDPNGGAETTIALDTGGGDDASEETTTGHEIGHAFDFNAQNAISDQIAALNPAGYTPTGESKRNGFLNPNSPVIINGNRITNDAYGASDQYEQMATDMQNIDVPEAHMSFNQSTFEQGELDVIMYEEQQQPGFAARLLQRVRADKPSVVGNKLEGYWDNARLPGRYLGIATLIGLAGLRVNRKWIEKRQRAYTSNS